jgi:membrane-associated phospholipid phosphatase
MTKRREKALVALSLAATLPPLFFAVAALAGTRAMPPPDWIVTPIDRMLPVVPLAVWPYLSWYVAPALIFAVPLSTFRKLCASVLLSFLLCAIGHLTFPITMTRPVLAAGRGLSTLLLHRLYAVDPPVNLFPSFHAAIAVVVLYLQLPSRPLMITIRTWMGLVCISCVLTKQHYILDVIAGALVGHFASLTSEDVVRIFGPKSTTTEEIFTMPL